MNPPGRYTLRARLVNARKAFLFPPTSATPPAWQGPRTQLRAGDFVRMNTTHYSELSPSADGNDRNSKPVLVAADVLDDDVDQVSGYFLNTYDNENPAHRRFAASAGQILIEAGTFPYIDRDLLLDCTKEISFQRWRFEKRTHPGGKNRGNRIKGNMFDDDPLMAGRVAMNHLKARPMLVESVDGLAELLSSPY